MHSLCAQVPWHGIDLVLHLGGQVPLAAAMQEATLFLRQSAEAGAESSGAEAVVKERFREEYRTIWNLPSARSVLSRTSHLTVWSARHLMDGFAGEEDAEEQADSNAPAGENSAQPQPGGDEDKHALSAAARRVLGLAHDVFREYERQLWDEDWDKRAPDELEGGFVMWGGGRIGCLLLDQGEFLDDLSARETRLGATAEALISDAQRARLEAALKSEQLAVLIVVSEVPLFWKGSGALPNAEVEKRRVAQAAEAEKILQAEQAGGTTVSQAAPPPEPPKHSSGLSDSESDDGDLLDGAFGFGAEEGEWTFRQQEVIELLRMLFEWRDGGSGSEVKSTAAKSGREVKLLSASGGGPLGASCGVTTMLKMKGHEAGGPLEQVVSGPITDEPTPPPCERSGNLGVLSYKHTLRNERNFSFVEVTAERDAQGSLGSAEIRPFVASSAAAALDKERGRYQKLPDWWSTIVPLDSAIFADDVVWFHAAADVSLTAARDYVDENESFEASIVAEYKASRLDDLARPKELRSVNFHDPSILEKQCADSLVRLWKVLPQEHATQMPHLSDSWVQRVILTKVGNRRIILSARMDIAARVSKFE